MLRVRAVKSLLLEDVAALALPRGSREDDPERRLERLEGELDGARRKALGMAVLAALAVVVLVLTHGRVGAFFDLAGVDVVYTLGVLAVASAAGFRLAQWEHLRRVARVIAELDERREDS